MRVFTTYTTTVVIEDSKTNFNVEKFNPSTYTSGIPLPVYAKIILNLEKLQLTTISCWPGMKPRKLFIFLPFFHLLNRQHFSSLQNSVMSPAPKLCWNFVSFRRWSRAPEVIWRLLARDSAVQQIGTPVAHRYDTMLKKRFFVGCSIFKEKSPPRSPHRKKSKQKFLKLVCKYSLYLFFSPLFN